MLSSALSRVLMPPGGVAASSIGRLARASLQLEQTRHKGHSKWQNIKHIKAANDAKNGRLGNKYSMRIGVAIKENGNQGDPKLNRQLAKVMEEALLMGVRKATIDAAVKRATAKDFVGEKEFIFEVRGPGQCSILVEALAQKKGQVEQDLLPVIKKNFGYIEAGVRNLFERRGVVRIDASKADLDFDQAEEIAIECDVEDVDSIETEEGIFFDFYCNPTQVMQTRAALADRIGGDASIVAAEARFEPTVTVPLGKKQADLAMNLVDLIYQKVSMATGVYHNIEFKRPSTASSEGS